MGFLNIFKKGTSPQSSSTNTADNKPFQKEELYQLIKKL